MTAMMPYEKIGFDPDSRRTLMITLRMPPGVKRMIDDLVKNEIFLTRSAFVREAIRIHLLRFMTLLTKEEEQ